VRADASVKIATGHVMRCLALSQAWQDSGGEVIYAMAQKTPSMTKRLTAEAITIVNVDAEPGSRDDASWTARLAKETDAEWAAIDGYGFGQPYQRNLRDADVRFACIDDNGDSAHYYGNLVLNQNVYAEENFYQNREPYTRLLLGANYALLRREFSPWREWKRVTSYQPQRILVTLGGSDPTNITDNVIRGLNNIHDTNLNVAVVVGGDNPHRAALEETAAQSRHRIELLISPSNMPELMAGADVAISAAGATCWEMCFFGVPLLLTDVAPNQLRIASTLSQMGLAVYLGNSEEISGPLIATALEQLLASFETRAQMSQRCRELIDGRGASRVVKELLSHKVDCMGVG
jgi:UDP-2,4-diacetamido-2,4,6-trideoxy-beta-L-altropyranose hydrolase